MPAPTVINAFIDRINAHDVDELCALMTEDHVLVDAGGDSYTGRESMRQAWRGYFRMIPDYFIRVEQVLSSGNLVALLGRAGGTYAAGGSLDPANRWEVPAAWQATVQEDRIARWQVYADNEPLRRIMQRVARGVDPA